MQILGQEREMSVLRNEIGTYAEMLGQVSKHLRTLLKYLHGQVNTTKDPTVIEQANRQIRSIEKLRDNLKKSLRHKDKKLRKVCLDTLFSASESNFEAGNFTGRESMQSSMIQNSSQNNSRSRISGTMANNNNAVGLSMTDNENNDSAIFTSTTP